MSWWSSKRNLLMNALSLGGRYVSYASGVYVVFKYGGFLSQVSGPSMFPTFHGVDDIVLVEAVSPWLGTISSGDIVICVRPVNPAEHIIKRVVAVAGDEVVVYPDKHSADIRRVKVPEGHVWVQGDNLPHSLDSRAYGPVPLALVKGRVVAQIWPTLKRIQSGLPPGMSFARQPGKGTGAG